MARRTQDFQTIRSEGGLLPPDLLRRVLDPKEKLAGTAPQDYGLAPGERLNEVITQSWNRLQKHWVDFRASAKDLPGEEAGTKLTNEKWGVPLLRELGFGMLPTSIAPEINGKTYAINRFFGATAVHLIGCQVELDKRAKGVRGAAIANPHGLVQDFLNRSDAHLWAVLSNGLRLRILRDSQAISRQSYLEFDLEAMFDGEVFSDFVLLWLMAHATRFAAREGERPETCWLEQWTKIAEEQGTRALGDLKQGVEKALEILGQGFVGHPKNTALRDALRTGSLPLPDFHGQLLRVVYRLIFLFVAEDRTLDGLPLLHAPDDSEAARIARERYHDHYSAGRLREMAGAIRGSRHGDLWWQLNLVVGALSGEERFMAVREQLALPVLGSFLWSPDSTAALNAPSLAATDGAELANADFLEAIRKLAYTEQGRVRRPVDYKNLGAEELGGVYESLLALTPQVSGDGAKFTFAEFAGNERKTSGSYYTPDSLVQCLLDSALDPVVEEAIKGKSGVEAEKAILALKVCDPAVGSGHFLVGAAHRLARHLARIRATAQGEGEPSPGFYQHALRDVIGRCLYGVDINPMAAELCRVSLWLEALDPGKPLSFLDHHIRVGNSLLGTTPELIAGGLPDDTFTAIEGDEKPVCTQLRKRNKAEREGFSQGDLLGGASSGVTADVAAITEEARKLDSTPDDTADAVRRKADQFHRLVVSPEYKHAQRVADAWCAAFVWPKTVATLSDVVTTGVVQQLTTNPNVLAGGQRHEVERLSGQYRFFHWHLAFPEVFAKGGFDCVLGNPPWKMTEEDSRVEEGDRAAEEAEGADSTNETQTKRERAYYSRSGRLPLSAQNRMQLARLFAEMFTLLRSPTGTAGIVVPSTLTVNAFDRPLWTFWVRQRLLSSVWDFVNTELLFPEVDSRQKFAVICLSGSATPHFQARCWMTNPSQIRAEPDEIVRLSEDDLARYSGSDLSLPHFRGRRDLTLLARAISMFGRVSASTAWRPKYVLLGATNDREFVRDRRRSDVVDVDGDDELSRLQWVPLYEGKMVGIYDHRVARVVWKASNVKRRAQEQLLSEVEKRNPEIVATPLWKVPRSLIERRDSEFAHRGWDISLCDVTSALNERTAIAAVVPLCFATHNLPLIRVRDAEPQSSATFLACLASFATDYFSRLRVATNHLTEGIFDSLPVPSLDHCHGTVGRLSREAGWVERRVLELTYTAWDLEPFAKDCCFDGPPFRWDEDRRFLIRAELDAAFFHLYLPSNANGDWVKAEKETEEDLKRLKESLPRPRDAVEYIMDTFPIVKRKDEAAHGSYRTKERILEIYDEMQESIRTGKEYQTRLSPPPGDRRCCHPAKEGKAH